MAEFTGVRAKAGGIEIRWKVKGKQYSRFINNPPTKTNLENASRQRKKFIESCKLDEYESLTSTTLTFAEVAQATLEHKATRNAQSTLDSMQSKLNNHWSGLFDLPIDCIKLTDIRSVEHTLKYLSRKTLKNSISDMKQVFKYAHQEGLIEFNPTLQMEPVKAQKPKIDSFTQEERDAVLAALAPKFRLFYSFMFLSGMRTGEVRGLKWTDRSGEFINVERSIYKGQAKSIKTYQARDVLLHQQTIDLLDELQPERFKSPWIFSPQGTQLPYATERSLTIQFKDACKAAEVRYRRPYYSRHTYVTLALEKGVKPSIVATQIGDRLETMQRNYANIENKRSHADELRKAFD